MSAGEFILAFDTANESIAIGIGRLITENLEVERVASSRIEAHRASNTQLLPNIDAMLRDCGIGRKDIAAVLVGRGPGSFTGVRIAMATAKGIAGAIGAALIGVSTQDAVAQAAWLAGARGSLLVVSDAMRKEVYPAHYSLADSGVIRLDGSSVAKAKEFAESCGRSDCISGDALCKYADLFEACGEFRPKDEWMPSAEGLFAAFQDAWRNGQCDPFDNGRHAPGVLLPIYTRLSDAEENERAKLACNAQPKDLDTGVQGGSSAAASACICAEPAGKVEFLPFDAAFIGQAQALEDTLFGSDAWNADMVADDISRSNRIWWMALCEGRLAGYAGALVVDGETQILKVAVDPASRRRGIATGLVGHVAYDALNLASTRVTLEVRVSNEGAIGFYRAIGFEDVGVRPGYYSDGENALIMECPIGCLTDMRVAGDRLDVRPFHSVPDISHPLILAIESSCDETCASVIDGEGRILSDVVASQIDFHARFGGVVPEIASRKHIEAVCGVADIALERAGVEWGSLDAVASTYAPGLVGALVVGVAFAKGAAWALDVPFIGVNHLEGHLYANKMGLEDDAPFEPPAVVSLVSGGNTMLVYMEDWGSYRILGATIDDAVGEAFDKVAKALGLPYPGGPVISKLAESGNPDAIDFPRALLHSKDFRFSLSGLKTAVSVYIDKCRESGNPVPVEDICASFQQAVIDVQVAKVRDALLQTEAPTFCLGGGVAANPELRCAYENLCADMGVRLIMPPLSACGDNAAMIALVALERYRQSKFFGLDADAYAHADLAELY